MYNGYLLDAQQLTAYINWAKDNPFMKPTSPYNNKHTAKFADPDGSDADLHNVVWDNITKKIKQNPQIILFRDHDSIDSNFSYNFHLQATVGEYLKLLKRHTLWSYQQIVRYAKKFNAQTERQNHEVRENNAMLDQILVKSAKASPKSIHYRRFIGNEYINDKSYDYLHVIGTMYGKAKPLSKATMDKFHVDVREIRHQLRDEELPNLLIKDGSVYFCPNYSAGNRKFMKIVGYGAIAYVLSAKKYLEPPLDLSVIPKKSAFKEDAVDFVRTYPTDITVHASDSLTDQNKIVDYKRFVQDTAKED